MTRSSRFSTRHAGGFTLIEVLVALVLGLFLIAGVIQVYMGGKRSYNTQEGMSRLQENGRIGTFFLQRTLRQAGFYSSPGVDPNSIFTSALPAVFGTEGGTQPDTVTVRFQGGVGMTDCFGSPVAADVLPTNTNVFSLSAANATTGLRSLQCSVNGGAPQPLVEGITDLQIWYGIDTTLSDTNSTANRYVTANNVSNWAHVKSVRIILTANSMTAIDVGKAPREQAFATTIALRNRI